MKNTYLTIFILLSLHLKIVLSNELEKNSLCFSDLNAHYSAAGAGITDTSAYRVNLKKGHALPITQICISKDNKYIISTSHNENSTLLWDLRSGKLIRSFTGSGFTKKIGFLNGSKYIVRAGGSDRKGQLIIWDVKKGNEAFVFKPAGMVLDFSISPDEKRIAALSLVTGENLISYQIEIFDISDQKVIKTISIDKYNPIFQVRYLPEGNRLLLSGFHIKGLGGYNFIKIYNLNFPDDPQEIKIKDDVEMRQMNVSKDGKYACFSSSYTHFFLIDIATGKSVLSKDECRVININADFTSDSKYLVLSEVDKISVRSLSNAKVVKTYNGVGYGVLTFSDDGKYLASINKAGTRIILIDAESGKTLKTISSDIDAPFPLCITPDGKYFIYGGEKINNRFGLKLFEIGTGKFVKSMDGNNFFNASIKSSSDGRYIVGNWPSNRTLNYWDMETKEFKSLTIPDTTSIDGITQAGFTGNNKYIVACCNAPALTGTEQIDMMLGNDVKTKPAKICVWETSSGKFIKEIIWESTNFYTLTPAQGDQVVVASYNPALDGILGEKINVKNYNVISETTEQEYTSDYSFIYSMATNKDKSMFSICFLSKSKTKGILQIWDMINTKMTKEIPLGESDGAVSMQFSYDSKYLAVGMLNNDLRLYEATTGNLISTFKGHTGNIISTIFSPDNKYLYSVGVDLVLKMWDLTTKKLVASFVRFSNPEDFIIFTPDNYYTSTRNAIGSVYFTNNSEIIPFEQMDLKYNRPDIVLKRIGMASTELIKSYSNAYQKRIKRLGFDVNKLGNDMHLPHVSILNENDIPLTTSTKNISINIEAKDELYKLNTLNIYVNDIPLFGLKGISLKDSAAKIFNKKIDIELSQGENKIQISVINEKGVESEKATVYTLYSGNEVKPDLYLITIGVSNYKNPQLNLTYSVKDGKDIINTFAENKAIYENVFVDSLFDKNAVKEKINALKQKLIKTNVDDLVLISISGHGFLDNEFNFYYGTYDIDYNNPGLRGLSYDELESLLDGIPARKKVLFLDACHSGEVDKGDPETINADIKLADGSKGVISQSSKKGFKMVETKEKPIGLKNSFELMQELFADLSRGSGAVVVSAASGKGYALESPKWKNGVFTYCVINGLKNQKADTDGKNGISISELREYVMKEVKNLTNGAQTPTSRQDNLDFDFIIW